MHMKCDRSNLFYYFVSGILFLFLAPNALAAADGESAHAESSRTVVLPPWSLPDANGNVVDFSPQENAAYRVVLFWATWCPYCKALMPHLEAFRAKHEKATNEWPIEFLALNVWEDGDPAAYLAKSGYQFRLIPNADHVAKNYGVKGTPGLLLVNQNNEVLYTRRSGTTPEQVITDLEFIIENQRAAKN